MIYDGGAAQVRNALSERCRLGVTAQGKARRRLGGSSRTSMCGLAPPVVFDCSPRLMPR